MKWLWILDPFTLSRIFEAEDFFKDTSHYLDSQLLKGGH